MPIHLDPRDLERHPELEAKVQQALGRSLQNRRGMGTDQRGLNEGAGIRRKPLPGPYGFWAC